MLMILQSIVSAWESKYIWIDQYCIRQDSEEERAQQVRLMKNIYRDAAETVIWLGDVRDNPQVANGAFQLPQRVHDQLQGLTDQAAGRKRCYEVAMQGWLFNMSDCFALATVLQRSWFSRVWVMQEATLSSNAVIHCGLNRVPWDDFCTRLRRFIEVGLLDDLLVQWRVPLLPPVMTKQRLLAFLSLNTMFKPSRPVRISGEKFDMPKLKEVLRLSQRMDSTNAKDRIYAILGMCADGDKMTVRYDADYSLASLFHDVAIQMVSTTSSCSACEKEGCPFNQLSILGETGWRGAEDSLGEDFSSEEKESLSSLPSWVPVWRPSLLDTMWFAAHNSGYNASGSSFPIVDLDALRTHPQQLRSWGLICDEVLIATAPGPRTSDRDSSMGLLPQLALLYGLLGIYSWIRELWAVVERHIEEYSIRAEDFCRTLCGNVISQHNSLSDAAPITDGRALLRSFEDYMHASSMIADLPTGLQGAHLAQTAGMMAPLEEGYDNFIDKCTMCQDRRFLLTKQLKMGLGPVAMQSGDVVCIFAGAPVPVVLRLGAFKGLYTLIGECYVHGLMNGEYWDANSQDLEQIVLV